MYSCARAELLTKALLGLVLPGLFSATAWAGIVIQVPGDYASIGAAMTAATDGFTITNGLAVNAFCGQEGARRKMVVQLFLSARSEGVERWEAHCSPLRDVRDFVRRESGGGYSERPLDSPGRERFFRMLHHRTTVRLAVALVAACALPTASATFISSVQGDRLILTQTSDLGAVVVDNNGAGGAFRVIEGGVTNFVAANGLEVIMLNNGSQLLTIDFDNPVIRDVVIDVGNGTRMINFTGASNTVRGFLEIRGGAGDQTVELAVNAPLKTGGDLNVDLGIGNDIVDEDGNNLTIGGNLLFRGVNRFENNGTMLVTGDATVRTNFETQDTLFDDDQSMTILGNLDYKGGDGRDEVTLNGTTLTLIGGNVKLDARGHSSGGGAQYLWINGANTRIGGNLTVKARNSARDDYQSISGAIVGGNILVDLGPGANEADFFSSCGGSSVVYKGGAGVDEVVCDLQGRNATVKIMTEGGADFITLDPSSNLRKLFVDGGAGVDSYTDNFGGPTPFKRKLKNLP